MIFLNYTKDATKLARNPQGQMQCVNRLSNFDMCLDSRLTFCDRACGGAYPKTPFPCQANDIQVKCCKSSCKVTDIKDLLACHFCYDKAVDKFYDMYNASWYIVRKAAGISIISGSVCCKDHFGWHRMNCLNASVEDGAYIFNCHKNQS
ncbi:hypothetical protein L2E82_37470 [Cichorium intybus]|uniref:Uncharacterized protein n=1 Tax=Cichorium intybus TaxID=13427 RepID=A0ACB9AG01_CICIN|nr:hypothetical protein L2E82_37470 [Cichorium intybus]